MIVTHATGIRTLRAAYAMAAPDFPVDATVALLDDEHRASPTGAKQKSTLLTVCPFILGNEFCERLAFYG